MGTSEIIHLAFAPLDGEESGLVEKIASVIQKDPYSTRLLLAARVPRILAQFTSLPEAKKAVHSLESLGLKVLLCDDSTLREPISVFKAVSLQFGEDGIIFSDKAGQTRKIETGKVSLIIQGTMQVYQEVQFNDTKKKINLTATLLAGGIPIRRTVQEKRVATTVQTENFLRLFESQPSDICVEINPRNFNFSGLGKDMAPSSLANFSILGRKIRDVFPEAIFDETLTRIPGANIPAGTAQSKIDISCRLIYSFHQAFSRPQSQS